MPGYTVRPSFQEPVYAIGLIVSFIVVFELLHVGLYRYIEKTNAGILTISTPGSKFFSGRDVPIEVTFRNTSWLPICIRKTNAAGNDAVLDFGIRVMTEDGKYLPYRGPGSSEGVDSDSVAHRVFLPGQGFTEKSIITQYYSLIPGHFTIKGRKSAQIGIPVSDNCIYDFFPSFHEAESAVQINVLP